VCFATTHETDKKYFHMAPCPPHKGGELRFEELLFIRAFINLENQ